MQAAWELLRYDVLFWLRGFPGVRDGGYPAFDRPQRVELESLIPLMVAGACSFYWKKVLCLQRAIVTARLLRRYGFGAEVVIGCRMLPFAGHAWVEIDGRVVNDSRGYQQKLRVLERF